MLDLDLWDHMALMIGISVPAVTFFIAMRIVRAEQRRTRREMGRWEVDMDLMAGIAKIDHLNRTAA